MRLILYLLRNVGDKFCTKTAKKRTWIKNAGWSVVTVFSWWVSDKCYKTTKLTVNYGAAMSSYTNMTWGPKAKMIPHQTSILLMKPKEGKVTWRQRQMHAETQEASSSSEPGVQLCTLFKMTDANAQTHLSSCSFNNSTWAQNEVK